LFKIYLSLLLYQLASVQPLPVTLNILFPISNKLAIRRIQICRSYAHAIIEEDYDFLRRLAYGSDKGKQAARDLAAAATAAAASCRDLVQTAPLPASRS
jgi:hypothetical protein